MTLHDIQVALFTLFRYLLRLRRGTGGYDVVVGATGGSGCFVAS